MATLQKLFGDTVGRLIFKHVTISRITALTPHFRRLELEGEVGAPKAGDKVQVALDEGLRTYTPFGFEPAAKTVQLLAWLHGDATPGARWAGSARVGDQVSFFGPRRSLPLEELSGTVVLFGDESSFAVASALAGNGRSTVRPIFEVADALESGTVLDALGLQPRELVERRPGRTHLATVVEQLRAALGPGPAQLVLTGNAASIQAVRAQLKQAGVTAKQLNKAYWAEGKRGLD
jgi:NADPH-dependent ferric siderophore reductase